MDRRTKKKEFIAQMQSVRDNSSVAIVVHYHGLNVDDMNSLRKDMRASNATFLVSKNTLAKITVDNSNFASMSSLFKGPTAIAWSQDPVSVCKVILKHSQQNNKLAVIGGIVDNELVSLSMINELATLPSLDELRAKLIGLINTPARNLASIIQAPAAQTARVIDAYANKA